MNENGLGSLLVRYPWLVLLGWLPPLYAIGLVVMIGVSVILSAADGSTLVNAEPPSPREVILWPQTMYHKLKNTPRR